MFPRKAAIADFEGSAAKLDDDDLAYGNQYPNYCVHLVLLDPFEDVLLVVNLPRVEHVEDLDNDEDIENVSVVSAWTQFISILAVERCSVPVSQPTREYVGVLFILKSPFQSGLWEKEFATKHNSIYNQYLEN